MLAVFAIAILIKSAKVQLIDGKKWRATAERQQMSAQKIPAPRGEILDATKRVIAQSREMVRLEIAPREVRERAKLRRALQALRVEPSVIARALDSTEKYLTIPGRFLATDASTAMQIRGVKSFATLTRAYAASQSAQGIVGHVDYGLRLDHLPPLKRPRAAGCRCLRRFCRCRTASSRTCRQRPHWLR